MYCTDLNEAKTKQQRWRVVVLLHSKMGSNPSSRLRPLPMAASPIPTAVAAALLHRPTAVMLLTTIPGSKGEGV